MLLLVAPLSGGVGVVLVLLDAFDQAAVRTEVPLREEESTAKVSKQSATALKVKATQLRGGARCFNLEIRDKDFI